MHCYMCRAAGFTCHKCRQEAENDRINLSIPTDRMDTYHVIADVVGPNSGNRRR